MAEHQIYIQTGRHLFFYYSDHVTEVIERRLVVMQQLSVTRRGRPRAGSHRKLMSSVSLQASYGVEDPEYAVTQLAQTTMRSELGKLTLDKVFRVRNMCALTLQQKKGKRCVCVCTLNLSPLWISRKGSLSIPTWSTPSTRRPPSGESAACAMRSKTYKFLPVLKTPCRCR